MLTIYRILSFLILPMALLFSISFLILITAAFANPPMLLQMFLFACVSIYTYASMNFLFRGIGSGKFLGKSAKDWLRVNGIVSSVYAVLLVTACATLIAKPEMMKDLIAQAKQNAGDELKISDDKLASAATAAIKFIIAYGVVLFIHVGLTFGYMKTYRNLFEKEITE